MTHQSRPWSAVDAIINAGRNGPANASSSAHSTSTTQSPPAERGFAESPAAILLARVLSASLTAAKPCVQFVACGERASASAVAMATCRAAATILGRSLLLNARMDHDGLDEATHEDSPVPDAFLSGLYHYRLTHNTADLDFLFNGARRGTLTSMIAPFQFVAIDSRAPSSGPAGTALAPMCSGTVLVVRAGGSSHAAIKEVASQITRAGGRIIGSVLDEAPVNLPGWIRQA